MLDSMWFTYYSESGESKAATCPAVDGAQTVGVAGESFVGLTRMPSAVSLGLGERAEDVEEGWVDFVFVRGLHVEIIEHDIQWRLPSFAPQCACECLVAIQQLFHKFENIRPRVFLTIICDEMEQCNPIGV